MPRLARAMPALVLLAPLLVLVAFAYDLPFLGVAGWSVTLPHVGLGQYRALENDPLVQTVFVRTFRICGIVTLVATSAAYVIACVWTRGRPWQRRAAEFCILVPFWLSVLTRAFGWVALLAHRGLLNTWLQAAGVIAEPLDLSGNEFSVVLGMTHFLIPFAVFPLASSMRAVDERVLLAARGLGAGRARVFWTVFVPMTRPGILGAAVLVFVFALGFFVTPAILGGGRSVMLAELVYTRIFQSPDWGQGAAISVVLVAIVASLLAALFRLVRPQHLVGSR